MSMYGEVPVHDDREEMIGIADAMRMIIENMSASHDVLSGFSQFLFNESFVMPEKQGDTKCLMDQVRECVKWSTVVKNEICGIIERMGVR